MIDSAWRRAVALASAIEVPIAAKAHYRLAGWEKALHRIHTLPRQHLRHAADLGVEVAAHGPLGQGVSRPRSRAIRLARR